MCQHENTSFSEGYKVCTDCGRMFEEQVYITSYNRTFSYRRQPVYSRQKRFYHFILSSENPVVFQNVDNIMDKFGYLEFFWSMDRPKTRKYFFNRFVTLVFILDHLGIDTKGMRTLKDKERVAEQCIEMAKILKKSLF